MELRAVDGRLSSNFNIFHDYKLASVVATDTRLMGVVALRFEWRSRQKKSDRLFQIIHLDYSEYGIDDYEEYTDNLDEMRYAWSYKTSVMGARTRDIPTEVAVKLIELALDVYKRSALFASGEDEHKDFRSYAEHRFNIMKQELIDQDSLNLDDLRRLSTEDAYRYAIPGKLATNEVINYFLMRLIDMDFSVLPLLTDIPEEELRDCELARHGLQSLIKCNISSVPRSDQDFVCLAVTLGDKTDKYFYSKINVRLSGGAREKNRIVNSINVEYFNKLSDYESAMQTKRTEYITVYDVDDSLLSNFSLSDVALMANVDPVPKGNGWLYTIYNQTNDHVNRSEFHLNDDVFGTALLSIPGELVIMSYRLVDIDTFEASLMLSESINRIHLKGRYQVENQVFQTMVDTTGAMFEDLIVY